MAQLFRYSPEAAVSEIAEIQRNVVPFPEELIPRQVCQSSCGWKLFWGGRGFFFFRLPRGYKQQEQLQNMPSVCRGITIKMDCFDMYSIP